MTETEIILMLTTLRHQCDEQGLDFGALDRVAHDTYLADRFGDGFVKCQCGHRRNSHEWNSDKCRWNRCECCSFTPREDDKPSYNSEMGQGGAGYNDMMFGDGGE